MTRRSWMQRFSALGIGPTLAGAAPAPYHCAGCEWPLFGSGGLALRFVAAA